MRLKFIFSVIIIIITALAQEFRILEIQGINPNLIIIALSIFAFKFERALDFFALALVGVIFSKTTPFLEIAPLTIFLIAVILWFGKKVAPWSLHIGFLISLFVATTIFYVTIDRSFILTQNSLFLSELAYNLSIGGLVWFMIYYFTNEASRRPQF